MRDEIYQYVKSVAEKKNVEIGIDTDLFDTGVLDSLEIITLLSFLRDEKNLHISYDDLQFENFQTVKNIIKWAEKQA